MVPVGYGRSQVGSTVISVSSTNVDKSVWEENNMSVFGGIKTVYKRAPYAGGFGGGGLRGAAMWSVGGTIVDRIQD